jgi:hypothetical protein
MDEATKIEIEAHGYKPIETAPKDGTVVWFTNDKMWNDCLELKGKYGQFVSDLSGRTFTGWHSIYGEMATPTHWKPAQ